MRFIKNSYYSDNAFRCASRLQALRFLKGCTYFKVIAFVFYLYADCREAEPFFADLNGKWLTIKSTDAKSHKTRDIKLNEVTRGIVHEMRDRYQGQDITFFKTYICS